MVRDNLLLYHTRIRISKIFISFHIVFFHSPPNFATPVFKIQKSIVQCNYSSLVIEMISFTVSLEF